MALIGSIIFLCLSAFIAIGNIGGCVAASRRARKNIPGGYSCVPLLSLVFSAFAWAISRDTLGLWAFVPALLDPGTLMTLYFPIAMLREFRSASPTN